MRRWRSRAPQVVTAAVIGLTVLATGCAGGGGNASALAPPPTAGTGAGRTPSSRQSVARPGTTRQNSAGAVVALRMVSPESGWEVTRTQVLTTGDGGRHWVDVTPPSYIGGADAFFLDAAHAWILTNRNTLLRTADGGKTWTRGHPPANAMGGALAFSDARHGWLLVSRSMSMFQNAVDIYRTTDGGVSWTKVDSTGRDAAPGSLPFAGDKGGISFRDGVHGWVTLDVPETGPQALYRTADGGKTWALQTLPNPPRIDLSQYQVGLPAPPTFFNHTFGALALGIAGPGSATTTVVYTTSDGGSVWHPLSPLPAAPGLWNPTFVSRTVFWMVNRGTGALRRSVNGGKTWTAITPAAPPPGGLQNYAVTFASARVGFAWRFEQPGQTGTGSGLDGLPPDRGGDQQVHQLPAPSSVPYSTLSSVPTFPTDEPAVSGAGEGHLAADRERGEVRTSGTGDPRSGRATVGCGEQFPGRGAHRLR